MYQALYRKYRSQTFGQLVGQQVVATTLRQAVEQGKISHAYLFSGPRGTGKTSVAKIFAKAMNCPNQKDGEPCNDCYICKAITEGSLEDVIEIDAASNNGVDEIRDIRDKSTYALVWLSTRSILLTRCTCSQQGHLTPCSRPWKNRQKMWSLS